MPTCQSGRIGFANEQYNGRMKTNRKISSKIIKSSRVALRHPLLITGAGITSVIVIHDRFVGGIVTFIRRNTDSVWLTPIAVACFVALWLFAKGLSEMSQGIREHDNQPKERVKSGRKALPSGALHQISRGFFNTMFAAILLVFIVRVLFPLATHPEDQAVSSALVKYIHRTP